MKTLDVLKAAKQLISTPERWTAGSYARDKSGVPVLSVSTKAACWCAIGACAAVEPDVLTGAFEALKSVVPGNSISKFNDHPSTTHADVMAAFDRAIAKLEGGSR